MYILKMYTGLKNNAIGELFGVSLSVVNKAALRVNIQRKKQKNLGGRIEKIAYSAFKVWPVSFLSPINRKENHI